MSNEQLRSVRISLAIGFALMLALVIAVACFDDSRNTETTAPGDGLELGLEVEVAPPREDPGPLFVNGPEGLEIEIVIFPEVLPPAVASGHTAANWEEFTFSYQIEHSDDPRVTREVPTLLVRPPWRAWETWWPVGACAINEDWVVIEQCNTPDCVPVPFIEIFRCGVEFPDFWGCTEVTVQTLATFSVEGNPGTTAGSLASNPSNMIIGGACPDPMPFRIPIAVPEPNKGLGILCGLGGLAVFAVVGIGRRHP